MRTETEQSPLANVYRSSAWLWAAGLVGALALRSWPVALGWTIGSAVSCFVLWSLETIVRRLFVPGAQGAKKDLVRLSLAKLTVLTVVMCGIVVFGGRSFELILSFCAGILLTQSVIVFRAVRTLLGKRS